MSPTPSVGIFWDYENCPPSGYLSTNKISGVDIVKNIRSIAHVYGTVKLFKAYAELRDTSTSRVTNLRSELQSSGVSLIDCPHNGKKNVADMMMIVDMMVFAADYTQPSTIIVITADRDFAYAISTLRLRQHEVVVVAPFSQGNGLTAQAASYHDWDSEILEKTNRPQGHPRTKSLDATQRNLPPVVEIQPPSPPPPPPQPVKAPEVQAPTLSSPPAPVVIEVRPISPSPPAAAPRGQSAPPTPTPNAAPTLSADAHPFYPTLESYGFVKTRRRTSVLSRGSSSGSPSSGETCSPATSTSSQSTLLGDDMPARDKENSQSSPTVISEERPELTLAEDATTTAFHTPLSESSSLGRDGEACLPMTSAAAENAESCGQEQSPQDHPQIPLKTWASVASINPYWSGANASSDTTSSNVAPASYPGEAIALNQPGFSESQASSVQTTQAFVSAFSGKAGPTSVTQAMMTTIRSNSKSPFLNLISALQSQRAQGVLNPRSSVIAQSMSNKDADMQSVNVDRFSLFIALAQQQSILTISGPKGEERLTLKPMFCNAPVAAPAPAVLPTKPSIPTTQLLRFRHLITLLREYHAKGFGRVERSVIAEQLMARHGPRIFTQLGFPNWRAYGEEAKTLGIVIYDIQSSGGHTWIRLNHDSISS